MYLSTTLCLACSSSLPPPKKSKLNTDIWELTDPGIFTTPCCQRLICSSCIRANPRLQRYNPCLACLGGVAVVRSTPSFPTPSIPANVDGAVKDEDTFVLGDDEDEDFEADSADKMKTKPELSEAKHPVTSADPPNSSEKSVDTPPPKYHITKSDTLQGIVLRFKVDPYELCRLNNLPPSTLSTTPHLLHTRRILLLPPSAHTSAHPDSRTDTPEETRARDERHNRERAEKRLQTLTKEVDWRVAKAYVALADDPAEQEQEEWRRKRKEQGAMEPATLEARAIERYFDDDEWEEGQKRAGGSASGSGWGRIKDKEKEHGDGTWWNWRSG